jgi:hypothetical protein
MLEIGRRPRHFSGRGFLPAAARLSIDGCAPSASSLRPKSRKAKRLRPSGPIAKRLIASPSHTFRPLREGLQKIRRAAELPTNDPALAEVPLEPRVILACVPQLRALPALDFAREVQDSRSPAASRIGTLEPNSSTAEVAWCSLKGNDGSIGSVCHADMVGIDSYGKLKPGGSNGTIE